MAIDSRPGAGTRVVIHVPGRDTLRGAGLAETEASPQRPLSLLIVDDHEVVRQGLVALLGRRPEFQVVAEAGTVAEAVAAARRFRPDLVVMDVRLPDGSGIEACREIRAELPETRVVMLTSYPDEDAVLSAIIAGASGYLLKQVRARDLVAGLEAVGRGESLLDPAVTGRVLERVRRIATADQPDELAQLTVAGTEDPAPRRRRQDQQGDRGGGLPVGQDGQELRQLDPRPSSTSSAGRRPPPTWPGSAVDQAAVAPPPTEPADQRPVAALAAATMPSTDGTTWSSSGGEYGIG